ncbi:hypothetical protein PGQ11_011923 [Apiospora arundinis]|uniref:Uncharacterized protein n=1 Tax=Apiospora arundinis TaxID=335852 RepID=A0ABR2I129_9PEZI
MDHVARTSRMGKHAEIAEHGAKILGGEATSEPDIKDFDFHRKYGFSTSTADEFGLMAKRNERVSPAFKILLTLGEKAPRLYDIPVDYEYHDYDPNWGPWYEKKPKDLNKNAQAPEDSSTII